MNRVNRVSRGVRQTKEFQGLLQRKEEAKNKRISERKVSIQKPYATKDIRVSQRRG